METLNSKLEILNKPKIQKSKRFGFWSFEFVSNLGFRILNLLRFYRTEHTQQGSVLLLTLLLLSLFLFIGLAWSTIVLRGLKIVERADEAVVAFSSAESGVEDGLYRLLKLKELPKDLTGKKDTLVNGSRWERNVYNKVDMKIIERLGQSAAAVIDLYNPDVDPFTATLTQLAFGAASVTIAWNGPLGATMKVDLASWDGTVLVSVPSTVIGSGSIIDGLDAKLMYRLTITPSVGVRDVRVSATDKVGGAGATRPIPEALSIESNGFYRSATQAVRMRFPLASPIP